MSCRLEITDDGSGLRFSLSSYRGSEAWEFYYPDGFHDQRARLEKLTRELRARPPWGEVGAEVGELWDEVATYLGDCLPPDVVARLGDLDASGAWVTMEGNTDLPWEWAKLTSNHLWQAITVGFRPCDPPPPGAGKVLIVSDAQNLLPWTRKEVIRIQRRLQGRIGVDTLNNATCKDLVDALNTGKYSWVHLSLLSELNPDHPGKSRIYLADGPILAESLVEQRSLQWNGGFFLNFYQAAWPSRSTVPWDSFWIRLFQDCGATAVVGTLWDVPPDAAVAMADQFYSHVGQGMTANLALRKAREHLQLVAPQDPYLAAHAYRFYGSPTFELPGTNEAAVQPATMVSTLPEAAAPKGDQQRQYLKVIEGGEDDLEQLAPLSAGVLLIGRNPECGLRLRDPAVSRQHASISGRDGVYTLTHLGSTPTVVNGQPLVGGHVLKLGDRIQIGTQTVLEVSL